MDQSLHKNIVKTAEALFIKYGIRGVSIDDICNQLHISKKTFYTEFSQKEDVVREVHSHLQQKRRKSAEEFVMQPQNNVVDCIMLYRQPAQYEMAKKHELFAYELVKYYPDILKEYLDSRAADIKLHLEDTLREGVETGYFRSDLDVEVMSHFISLWHIHANTMMTQTDKYARHHVFEVVLDGLVRMLCSAKGLEYYETKYLNK